jgi:hypothetical protein
MTFNITDNLSMMRKLMNKFEGYFLITRAINSFLQFGQNYRPGQSLGQLLPVPQITTNRSVTHKRRKEKKRASFTRGDKMKRYFEMSLFHGYK